MDDSGKAVQAPVPDDAIPTEASAAASSREATAGSEESVRSGPKNLFPVRTEWTDEKHNLYLSSMESSFIDQLYNNEHGSNDLLGCLPKPTKDLGSNSNCLFSCQFKFLRMGRWQTLNIERKRTRFEIKNETRNLFANPWIQHFTSRTRPLNQVDSNELINRPIHSGMSTSPKQQHPSCSRMWHQNSPETNAEVSDQNFVDMDSEGECQTRMIRRKRAKAENIKSPVKDSTT